MVVNYKVFGIDWECNHKVPLLNIFIQERNKILINLLNKIQFGHIK